ncbi:MAG: PIG-L deacetylase family protein [Candidatus Acidiferrales bacterium]
MRVLVVAAHPDDEILGVGGTAALHIQRGDSVQLVILTDGVSMRYSPECQLEARKHSQQAAARQAAAVLGVEDLVIRELPDQRLDSLPLSQVITEVESLVRSFQPEIVYTHFGGDINRDHRTLAEAVLVATRPYAAPYVREVLMYETPSSTEWGAPQLSPPFQPNVFVDITDTLDKKLEAFACYSAEVCQEPHPRSLSALRDRARYWGSLVNRKAAEPFACVRALR